jgi:predicted PurR-regulated permease PerM
MLPVSNQREPAQQSTTPTSVWTRRLIVLLTILSGIVLVVLLLSGASHIITSILIFAVAALLAYAIAPVVELFKRVMPRALAILAVYLIVIILLGMLLYLIISTMVTQLTSLAESVSKLLTPGSNGQDSPLVRILLSIGLTHNQIESIAQQLGLQLTSIAGTVAGGIVPILSGIASAALNILLTVVISIYLLVDGSRAVRWLRDRTPITQRGRISSLVTTLQTVVGGYIRGQIALCLTIGTIVGVGMAILGLGSYAVLLGVLSFITEFIPVLGTIFCGTVAVLLALTQGWLTAGLVLAYFVLVHIFEGYVLAPRLIGKAVGVQPVISLLALTIGAELFGPWGAIFASPIAGLLQAFTVTFWINYQRTHRDEFPPEEQELTDKRMEKLATSTAAPTIPPSNDIPMKE